MAPEIAAATAVIGLARKVRAPGPWRPSKFRLLVLTAYLPGGTLSSFIAKHALHPASRHSAPAALKISCSPSASACCLTCCEPGTTITRTPAATWSPLVLAGASRGALDHASSQPQIGDARVGTAADENHIYLVS